ncbi:glycosyl transferase family 2 [Parvibaculum lavamentivorans DS-1]|uniref:Glycosyl transferase family 2 n=2 Tax=Parvibaculum lavamentivorans TaxID=256618 RepID=A7HQ64_PARL1|nr:glycosyl transferase family 2 [Parvibaculum lavamentivorans DS-1]
MQDGQSDARVEQARLSERKPGRRAPRGRPQPGSRPLLGEMAVEAGLVQPEALAPALEKQAHWGGPLGRILVSIGAMRVADVARLYGRQRGLPFVDLQEEPHETSLASSERLDFYLREMCLPWRRRAGETIYVAADPDRSRAAITGQEGRPLPVFVTSPRDISRTVTRAFGQALTDRAIFHLRRQMPESSAAYRLSAPQSAFLLLVALALLTFLATAPISLLSGATATIGITFLLIATLRYMSIFIGLLAEPTREELAFSNYGVPLDKDLPVYTVMVPLFREASVLPILATALRELDYPASKLDIKFIFEESDVETYEAAKALRLPDHFEFIVVPTSFPQTKPKACNFALPFARGEFLVIYDAEDAPEPQQLKKAVSAFRLGDEKLACVQAQLNYYNWRENWLTRQFALEYAAFFDLMLPTMARLRLPIPLGGTSTHFRTELLRNAGAWDPNNVTEDADLGLRFALHGYRCSIIRSTTEEEANCKLPNWVRQRSRWIKGWMQTYLVRMRHPVRLYRALGLRGFIGFQVLIGGSTLSSLLHPFLYLGLIVPLIESGLAGDLTGLTVFHLLVLVSGYALAVSAGLAAASARGLPQLFIHTLTMPAYWLLLSFAAYKALWQLVVKPFHWEKTDHGISRMLPARLKGPVSSQFVSPH